MSCRCRTINLAVESLDSLKKMESKLQKSPNCKPPTKKINKFECMPPPPGPVVRRKIIVCTTRPVKFQCPPLPCICPPCPECPTYTQRFMSLIKTGMKLLVLYVLVRWTVQQNIWGGHNGTTRLTLEFMEKNFPSEKGASLLSMQNLKYNILNSWDKLIGTLFYYTVALPLKVLTPPMSPEDRSAKGDQKAEEECVC